MSTSLLPVETESQELMAGAVRYRNGERLVVQCGDGPIEILTWSAI